MTNHSFVPSIPASTVSETVPAIQSNFDFPVTLGNILRESESGTLNLPYYIYGQKEEELKGYDVGYPGYSIVFKYADPGQYLETIKQAFVEIGEIMGVNFTEVSDPDQSLFDVARIEDPASRSFRYISDYGYGTGVLGLSQAFGNRNSKVWRLASFRESSFQDIAQKEADTRATIRHELGHSFGLSHPGAQQDGYNPAFNQLDTVMSYNVPNPANEFLTESDISAYKQIFNELNVVDMVLNGASSGPVQIDKSDPYFYDEQSQQIDELRSFSASQISQISKAFNNALDSSVLTKQFFEVFPIPGESF